MKKSNGKTQWPPLYSNENQDPRVQWTNMLALNQHYRISLLVERKRPRQRWWYFLKCLCCYSNLQHTNLVYFPLTSSVLYCSKAHQQTPQILIALQFASQPDVGNSSPYTARKCCPQRWFCSTRPGNLCDSVPCTHDCTIFLITPTKPSSTIV